MNPASAHLNVRRLTRHADEGRRPRPLSLAATKSWMAGLRHDDEGLPLSESTQAVSLVDPDVERHAYAAPMASASQQNGPIRNATAHRCRGVSFRAGSHSNREPETVFETLSYAT